jgi:hypothetical protein
VLSLNTRSTSNARCPENKRHSPGSRRAIFGHQITTCHLDGKSVGSYLPSKRGDSFMAEPQLSVRSAKARELAHRLARRQKRSIADVVERALEAYEVREAGREPASSFYARLSANCGTDVDLDAIIRTARAAYPPAPASARYAAASIV